MFWQEVAASLPTFPEHVRHWWWALLGSPVLVWIGKHIACLVLDEYLKRLISRTDEAVKALASAVEQMKAEAAERDWLCEQLVRENSRLAYIVEVQEVELARQRPRWGRIDGRQLHKSERLRRLSLNAS